MDQYKIEPSFLQGHLTIPPSKSQTLRAILFAALANGESRIESYLPSPDTMAMIQAVRKMGAKACIDPNHLIVQGFAGQPQLDPSSIDCGNSGLVLRFVGALAALQPRETLLTGDASLCTRSSQPLIDALNQLGASAVSLSGNGCAPLLIQGPLTKNSAILDGQDSQPVSALLIAGSFADRAIDLHVLNPGEKPWVKLTLAWLQRFGIHVEMNENHFHIPGRSRIDGFQYNVPGDFSSAAFGMAAAIISQSEIHLHNLDMSDPQGDKAIISIFRQMGAVIDVQERSVIVRKGANLAGITIDVNDCIDALPILAVAFCFAKDRTKIINAAIARNKESDRIRSITLELKKMGAHIEEAPDGLEIFPSPLHGAHLNAHQDHRIAMALTIAAFGASSPSTMQGASCIAKSYPTFLKDFQAIGGRVLP